MSGDLPTLPQPITLEALGRAFGKVTGRSEITPERGVRHQQMMLHKPCDSLGLARIEAQTRA